MQIFLHPGQGKTGTSSIQSFLFENHELLKSLGVLYPRSLGKNHNRLIKDVTLPSNTARPYKKDPSSTFCSKNYVNLIKEELFKNSECNILLLSAETLQTNVYDITKLLNSEIKPNNIQIIIYLRFPLSELALSSYQQRIKADISWPSLNAMLKIYKNHLALLHKCLQCIYDFKAKILIRFYNHQLLHKNDVRHDFMINALGTTHHNYFINNKSPNKSITAEEIYCLRITRLYLTDIEHQNIINSESRYILNLVTRAKEELICEIGSNVFNKLNFKSDSVKKIIDDTTFNVIKYIENNKSSNVTYDQNHLEIIKNSIIENDKIIDKPLIDNLCNDRTFNTLNELFQINNNTVELLLFKITNMLFENK